MAFVRGSLLESSYYWTYCNIAFKIPFECRKVIGCALLHYMIELEKDMCNFVIQSEMKTKQA